MAARKWAHVWTERGAIPSFERAPQLQPGGWEMSAPERLPTKNFRCINSAPEASASVLYAALI